MAQVSVQINGSWITTDPNSLSRLILQGQVQEFTPARDLTQSVDEGSLTQVITHSHSEEISFQLLKRLWSMYQPESNSAHPREILARVADLCKWKLSDQVLKGRLLWVAGWLSELTGLYQKAVSYYDQYLLQEVQETQLTLLAWNNRGRLRIIGLRDINGLRDLIKAIIRGELKNTLQNTDPLPAACFNLLNLINEAIRCDLLRDPVEDVLVDAMISLPKLLRIEWLGPDPGDEEKERRKGDLRRLSNQQSRNTTDHENMKSDSAEDTDTQKYLREHLHILRDSNLERLNIFTAKLAHWAHKIADVQNGRIQSCPVSVSSQLRLWAERPEVDVAGDVLKGIDPRRLVINKHEEYAEAASLLYVNEIPRLLTVKNDSLALAVYLAQSDLSRADTYVDNGKLDLARQTLETLQERLTELPSDPCVTSIMHDVEGKLGWIIEQQRQRDIQKLLRTHNELAENVNNLLQVRDLFLVDQQAEEILDQIEDFKADVKEKQNLWGESAVPVLEDLQTQVEKHQHSLRRSEIEEQIQEPWQQFLELRPNDWDTAVPMEAYDALKRCFAIDLSCLLRDWKSLKKKLDHHQAQYYLRQIIKGISVGHMSKAEASELIVHALDFNPNIGPDAAMILTFFSLSVEGFKHPNLEGIQNDLLSVANRLLETQLLEDSRVSSLTARRELIKLACRHLQEVIRLFYGMGEKVTALWNCLESGFLPALKEGRPDVVKEIEQMLKACLEACPIYAPGPAGANWDPRNKLWILLETCEVAILIGKGEDALALNPPNYTSAEQYFKKALEKPPTNKNKWHRAVDGFYVAWNGRFDPNRAQREILDNLDRWLDKKAETASLNSLKLNDVIYKITELRNQMSLAPEPEISNPSPDDTDTETDNNDMKLNYVQLH